MNLTGITCKPSGTELAIVTWNELPKDTVPAMTEVYSISIAFALFIRSIVGSTRRRSL